MPPSQLATWPPGPSRLPHETAQCCKLTVAPQGGLWSFPVNSMLSSSQCDVSPRLQNIATRDLLTVIGSPLLTVTGVSTPVDVCEHHRRQPINKKICIQLIQYSFQKGILLKGHSKGTIQHGIQADKLLSEFRLQTNNPPPQQPQFRGIYGI